MTNLIARVLLAFAVLACFAYPPSAGATVQTGGGEICTVHYSLFDYYSNGEYQFSAWEEDGYDCFPASTWTGGGGLDLLSGIGGGGAADGGDVGDAAEDGLQQCDGDEPRTERPVVISSGTKVLAELDFGTSGDFPLLLSRSYNSRNASTGAFGSRWSSSIDYGLSFKYAQAECSARLSAPTTCGTGTTGLENIRTTRPGGGQITLAKIDATTWSDPSGSFQMSQSGGTWVLLHRNGNHETYNAGGQPTSVRNEHGIGWTFNYTNGVLASITHTSGRTMGIAWSGGRISTITAPDARVYSYGYSGSGYLNSVRFPDDLGQRTYHYESPGQAWAVTGISVNGVRQTRYAYYTDGRVRESGLEGGREKSSFAYSLTRTDVTNAAGLVTRYHRSEEGRTVQVDRPASAACSAGITRTVHNAEGRVATAEDGSGNRTTYAYTPLGRISERITGIAPNGATTHQQITRLTWNAAQTRLERIQEYGASAAVPIRETVYSYYPDADAHGRKRLLQSVTVHDRTPGGAPARTHAFDYSFHPNGMLHRKWVDGPLAGADRVTYEYSAAGDLVSITNALGHVTTYGGHDGMGRTGRVIDPNGLNTVFAWDAKGRITRVTMQAPAGDRVHAFVYDATDNITRAIDPSGRSTSFEYNLGGLPSRISMAAAKSYGNGGTDTIDFRYDDLNLLTGVDSLQTYLKRVIVDWQGGEPVYDWVTESKDYSSSHWSYDAAGFLAGRHGNNGQDFRYGHDASGRLASIVDSLGRESAFSYDTHGRPKGIVAPNLTQSSFEYDAMGNVTSATDRKGVRTLLSYNGHGDLVRVESADGGTSTYTYDPAGRIATHKRADGSIRTFTRDLLGRVTKVSATWPSYHGIAGSLDHVFTYDGCTMGKGRLCGFTDASGSTSYTYLKSGELASQTTLIGGVSFPLGFGYDALGRPSTTNYPNGVSIRYTYTIDHRVKRIEARVGGVWSDVINNAVYQPFKGPLIGLVFGNGLSRQLDYDQDGRLARIHGVEANNPQSLVFSYDANDLVASIANADNPAASQSFAYTTMNELASASSTATGAHSWTYDANGNRSAYAWGGGTDAYAMSPASNRLAAITGPRSVAFGSDAAGSLRTSTRANVVVERRYDGHGRLSRFVRPAAQSHAYPAGGTLALPAGEWSYFHNALGHRVLKERTSPSSVKTHYLYSAHGLLLGESNPGSTGLDTIHVRLEGTPVGVIRGNQIYAVHADHVGRPEVLTNAAKAVVWRANNYAFDRAVTVDSIGGLSIGFPGQLWDAETGTWHNVFREYDASTGRYLSADPLGLAAGSNLFAYVGGNPVSFVDPLGLELCRARIGGLDDYLDTDFAPIVRSWHQLNAQSGIDTPFSSAFRSTAEQGMLDDRNSNTPAPAGNSLHEAGFAVDVHWRTGLTEAQQAIVRNNAAAVGLGWGGNFRTPDPVHFYVDPGNRTERIQDAQRRYHDGSADACSCQ